MEQIPKSKYYENSKILNNTLAKNRRYYWNHKASRTERIMCHICQKTYQRAKKSKHFKTLYHNRNIEGRMRGFYSCE